jgi:hypothetical protein
MIFPELPSLEKRYAKAICHLNHACLTQRLGLVLGSGVSYDLGIPKWTELINKIDNKLVYGSSDAPESYRAEQLFQHYRGRRIKQLERLGGDQLNAAVTAGWRDLVRQCLYGEFRDENGELNLGGHKEDELDQKLYETKIKSHPYLGDLGKLALRAQLVVTHNFDDALEVAIDLDTSADDPSYRRYHSFWRPEPFLRRGMVNIYHPNGYTPLRGSSRGSESLILTEASFADHLANTNTEESHFLLRHLADKTCLIIGHSLSDGTLKNALRQHANQRPAHVNYYVHWNKEGESGLGDDHRKAIREANFQTYNLITIFANSSEISEILKMVSMEGERLQGHLAHQSVTSRYVYYIVGAVSSGKSTTIRHLRDLETIEEWPANMPPVMNRPSVGLKKTDESAIDQGLEEAIWKKNIQIDNIKTGIVAVDRAPLDFIAFPSRKTDTLGQTARQRTSVVLKRFEKEGMHHLCSGQVIVVQSDTDILLERQLQRGGRIKLEEVEEPATEVHLKQHEEYLKQQQKRLAKIYKQAIDGGSVVKTNRCSIATSVKEAARIIHFGAYTTFDFTERLRKIKGGK